MASASENADRYYMAHGACCAGCDWWSQLNSVAGECRRTAPVPGEQRTAMLGMRNVSLPLVAGHVMTLREHHCGDFKDEFDWRTLSTAYLRRIGWPPAQRFQGQ